MIPSATQPQTGPSRPPKPSRPLNPSQASSSTCRPDLPQPRPTSLTKPGWQPKTTRAKAVVDVDMRLGRGRVERIGEVGERVERELSTLFSNTDRPPDLDDLLTRDITGRTALEETDSNGKRNIIGDEIKTKGWMKDAVEAMVIGATFGFWPNRPSSSKIPTSQPPQLPSTNPIISNRIPEGSNTEREDQSHFDNPRLDLPPAYEDTEVPHTSFDEWEELSETSTPLITPSTSRHTTYRHRRLSKSNYPSYHSHLSYPSYPSFPSYSSLSSKRLSDHFPSQGRNRIRHPDALESEPDFRSTSEHALMGITDEFDTMEVADKVGREDDDMERRLDLLGEKMTRLILQAQIALNSTTSNSERRHIRKCLSSGERLLRTPHKKSPGGFVENRRKRASESDLPWREGEMGGKGIGTVKMVMTTYTFSPKKNGMIGKRSGSLGNLRGSRMRQVKSLVLEPITRQI
ncbi:hypothetical protein TREMEDRAFT_64908 [Tremella mesenterica DSM 1558]|uniref:uncharacterized protein n=1 Tax=Tremella mesenterica (strain ATCC 24925 / CBS 8224 / DSM 1558 / NBRC 9311 / NRRL Y-6157 / RJB 2259-6 / UBC 559-6) TaxID=578456 RepID=UPI0003F4A1AB|nr:uncharacterized protein TREMEDRAFT_64908 [Tremella mesenterica DSM 1558]EIW67042.1 hypothetical protein TREMEDRAFT_64908 [Tremella mesenterica DSM 1558]